MLVPSRFPLYSSSALSGMNSHPNSARTGEKLPVPSRSKGREICPLQFGELGHGKEACPGWGPSASELFQACSWAGLGDDCANQQPVWWPLGDPSAGCLENGLQELGLQPRILPQSNVVKRGQGTQRGLRDTHFWGEGNRDFQPLCACHSHRVWYASLLGCEGLCT